ncbi:Uncharacterised protein [Mycobacterium tuberculosis]|nr:Uncharacterised protein [Mycobacterium tuberculosis]
MERMMSASLVSGWPAFCTAATSAATIAPALVPATRGNS